MMTLRKIRYLWKSLMFAWLFKINGMMTSITLLLVLHDVIWKIKHLLLAERELLTGTSVMTDFRRRIFCLSNPSNQQMSGFTTRKRVNCLSISTQLIVMLSWKLKLCILKEISGTPPSMVWRNTKKNNVEDRINFINTHTEFLPKREIFGRKLFAHS